MEETKTEKTITEDIVEAQKKNRDAINLKMAELKRCFVDGAVLTLIVRIPGKLDDPTMVITTDDMESVFHAMRDFENMYKVQKKKICIPNKKLVLV